MNVYSPLQLYRGWKQEIPVTALQGEPLFAIDSLELYLGDENGVVKKLTDFVYGPSEPGVLYREKIWIDTSNNTINRFDGTSWVCLAVASTINEDLSETIVTGNQNPVFFTTRTFIEETVKIHLNGLLQRKGVLNDYTVINSRTIQYNSDLVHGDSLVISFIPT